MKQGNSIIFTLVTHFLLQILLEIEILKCFYVYHREVMCLTAGQDGYCTLSSTDSHTFDNYCDSVDRIGSRSKLYSIDENAETHCVV